MMEAIDPFVFRFSIFILAIFVGYFVVWGVTPALHTPLMSVTNAISSVIVVGALIAVSVPAISNESWISKGLGFVALVLASVNIFGGFLVTQRMLAMYKKKEKLQITAVTKSGSNRFRGSAYDIQTNSDWDANSWVNEKNGDPKVKQTSTKTLGYTIGGPVGKPGGANKLFFFYSHEYRPVTAAINGGNPIRIRVPTALERAGDFSQTRDNTGALFNLIKDPNSSSPCTAANTAGCFQAGGVLGKIPADRLYNTGIGAPEPVPAAQRHAGGRHELQLRGRGAHDRQPDAAAGDSPRLPAVVEAPVHGQILRPARAEADHAGHDSGIQRRPESVPLHHELRGDGGLHDELVDVHRGHVRLHPKPARRGGAAIGATGTGGILVNPSANLSSLPGFPLLYPNAGVVDPRYYAFTVLNDLNPGWCDGNKISLPPAFGWGSRIMGTAGVGALPGPPNQVFPGFPEHQPHAGCRRQPDEGVGRSHEQGGLLQQPQLQGPEHRRRRRGEPRLPGLRQLRQRHQQRASTRALAMPTRRWGCSRSTSSSRS